MIKRLVPHRDTQIRFGRFLGVGGLSACVQLLSLALLKRHWVPSAAFTLAFVLGTATHYSLNRFWALPSDRRDPYRQFIEYLATAGMSYLLNFGLFRLSLDVIGLGVVWSAAVAVPPATLAVFLLLNYRVFRRGRLAPGG